MNATPDPTDPSPTPGQHESRALFATGAFLAALAVAAGAFGAHALEGRVPADLLATFETGARYHLSQSLGVALLALGGARWHSPALRASGWLVVLGTVIFAGSLYLLVLTGVRGLGAITPFGGVLLIAGWLTAGVAVLGRGRRA
jgi:uncharacterized membrane protein YgdD (TMEM256/DUF423 family)